MAKPAKPRTLRNRMIRISWLMVGGLLAITFLSCFFLLHHAAHKELDRRVMSAATPVVEHFQANRDKTMADLDEFGAPGRYFEVLDPDGQVLQRSHYLAADLELPANNDFALKKGVAMGYSRDSFGQLLRVAEVPFTFHGRPYILIAAISTFGSNHILDNFGEIVAILFPLSLLLAGLGSAWSVDKSLEPVRDLTAHAERMAERIMHPGRSEPWQPLPLPVPHDEIGRLTSTFNRLFSHADAVLRQLRQFVTDASHELRTPLTMLRGESEMLLSGAVPPEEHDKTLRDMDHELRRLTRIVDGLFTLSMADAGQLRLVREPVYLNEVLDDACALIGTRSAAKHIRIERNLGAEVGFRGDEAFLHELFVIFLDNAVKYSPASSRIRVTLDAEPGQVVIRFRDHGAGIGALDMDRIFERFYRGRPAGYEAESGSGLGLAIAQAIVTAHGGAIACASASGEGTTFTITLPRAGDAALRSNAAEPAAAALRD